MEIVRSMPGDAGSKHASSVDGWEVRITEHTYERDKSTCTPSEILMQNMLREDVDEVLSIPLGPMASD